MQIRNICNSQSHLTTETDSPVSTICIKNALLDAKLFHDDSIKNKVNKVDHGSKSALHI